MYIENIDLNTLETNKKNIERLFGVIEDISYYYPDASEAEKQNMKIYLSQISVWYSKNSEKINKITKSHPYLNLFEELKTDLDNLDSVIVNLITPNHNETLKKYTEWLKGEDAFYLIQSNHQSKTETIPKELQAFLNTARSIKSEKAGVYTLYICSGIASKDYELNRTPENLMRCAQKATNRRASLNELEPYGFDGQCNDLILFATSNKNVDQQDIATALQKHSTSMLIFLGSSTFNPKYDNLNSYYNGRKAIQHGQSFLSQLNKSLYEKDLNHLNLAPFMALLYNSDNTKIPFNVEDLLRINPFFPGTDTYPVYQTLRNIRLLEQPEKNLQLYNYYVSYIEKTVELLKNINTPFDLTEDTKNIFENCQKTILGATRNFTTDNLPESVEKTAISQRLFLAAQSLNEIYDKRHKKNNDNSALSYLIENMVDNDFGDFEKHLTKNNKKALNAKEKEFLVVSEKTKREIDQNIVKKYYDIFASHNYSENECENFSKIIGLRHGMTTHTFLQLDAVQKQRTDEIKFFHNIGIKKPEMGNILKTISLTDDFSKIEAQDKIKNDLILIDQKKSQESKILDGMDLVEKAWINHCPNYEMNSSTKLLFKQIYDAGNNGFYITYYNELQSLNNTLNRATNNKRKAHRDFTIATTIHHAKIQHVYWDDVKEKLIGLLNKKSSPTNSTKIKM